MVPSLSAMVILSLCGSAEATESSLFGFSTKSNLVHVDTATGAQTNIGPPYKSELSGQQLASIDPVRGIYYVLDFNMTTKAVNLIGLSLTDGTTVVDLTIGLQESAFVGVGQSVDVDPKSGVVIIKGQDATVMGHHIFSVDPFGKDPTKITTIAKIPAPAVGLLGGSSTVDWDLKIFYSPLVLPPAGQAPEPWDADSEITQVQRHPGGTWTPVVNANPHGPTPPPPVPKFRVELCGVSFAGINAGKVTVIPASKSLGDLGTLVFDYNAKPLPAVVGFSVTETSPNVYEKTLVKMHTADRGVTYKFSLIGAVKTYIGEMGPISTVDSVNRVHYSLLQPAQHQKGWVPSTGCAAAGGACKNGTSCCAVPPASPCCFNVPKCSAMPVGPPDMSAPFYVVGLDLDTAAVKSAAKICAITTNDCPWSLEYLEHIHGA
jgi:hypothetical protein